MDNKENNFVPAGTHITASKRAVITTNVKNLGTEIPGAKDAPVSRLNENKKWARWGIDDNFPANVMDDLAKNTVAMRALYKRAEVHYGNGLIYYKEVKDGGKLSIEPLEIPEIDDFLEANNIGAQKFAHILDLEILSNGTTLLVKGADDKIVGYKHQKMSQVRRELQNESTKRIERIYISLEKRFGLNTELVSSLPCYNPLIKKQPNLFAVNTGYASPFNTYHYELAAWNSIRENGWINIGPLVATLKTSLFKNQATIKYHVKVPASYWRFRFKNWEELGDNERRSRIDDWKGELDDFLCDVENTGKSFVSHYDVDDAGKAMPGFEIEAIDNKLKDDAFLPDTGASNLEVLFAIGISPSIIGVSPDGSAEGSGSSIRENYWALQGTMKAYRDESLRDLYLIKKLNGWPKELKWGYKDVDISHTLDQNPTGKTLVTQ